MITQHSDRFDADDNVARHVLARGVVDRDATGLQKLLASRQNVPPKRLVEPGPSFEQVEVLMEAAAAAPDHGQLTPWHFVLIPQERRHLLAEAFVRALVDRDAGATQAQMEAAREKAHRAPCLLLAVVHLDSYASAIPACERLVSLGCAIQNVLLTATALGYGSGLTSGSALESAAMRALFSLQPNEHAVCFVAVGTVSQAKPARQRPTGAQVLRVLAA